MSDNLNINAMQEPNFQSAPKTMNLEQLLEFLEEKGDQRSAQLHYAILERIRHGTKHGSTDALLGLGSPGRGLPDGFVRFRFQRRNDSLKKAVYYLVKHEQLGEHAACGLLSLKLKRFRGEYKRIALGKSCIASPLQQCLFDACWHDPGAFELKQGALFDILFS